MKTNKPRRLRVSMATGLAALVMLSACSSLERVPVSRTNPAEIRSMLRPGESVVVRLWDGEERRFEVQSLESDAIVGPRGQRVAYTDISTLDVSKVDIEATAKTALVAAGIVVGALALLVIEAELERDRTTTVCDMTGCETR